MQGDGQRELVRGIAVTRPNTVFGAGPFIGSGSLKFANNDAAVVVPTHTSYHPGNTLSVGGWFNRTGQGDDASGGPVLCHFGVGDFGPWFPAGTNAGRLVLRKAGTGDVFATATTDWGSPYTKGWHHVIFTKTGTTTKCYVDGVSDPGGGTTADQTFVAAATDPKFGLNSAGTNLDFDGLMAHWAVWNRVLTEAEAADLYRAGKASM
jgi:hypothetical protein